MKRRDFLASSAAAGLAPLAGASLLDAQQGTDREYYELRRYHTIPGARQRALTTYLSEVAIPALNRAEVGPVGAFTVVYGENAPTIYLLLTHRSLSSVGTLRERMMGDAEYVRAGTSFLETPLSEPGFVRVESTLMHAFTHMPKLEVPAQTPRIFELRRYESHSDPAAIRKIEMFNEGGEIAIFRKTGLTPVFFGEAIVGADLPNLTYMLTFPDMAGRDAAWATFSADPEWRTLSANPYYADTVSAITSVILRPTAYSQV